MLNFPVDTFWYIVPWPFIWLVLGFVMFFIHKKDDLLQEKHEKGDD